MNARSRYLLAAFALVAVVSTAPAGASVPAGRYTATGGTVLDNKTKLTWQQIAPSATYAWTAAKTYCQMLNLAGTGWRLPTLKELMTIVDYKAVGPSIDPIAFPATAGAQFWSASPVAGSTTNAWVVGFLAGGSTYGVVSEPHDVRCVR